jgi:hypothetical protein
VSEGFEGFAVDASLILKSPVCTCLYVLHVNVSANFASDMRVACFDGHEDKQHVDMSNMLRCACVSGSGTQIGVLGGDKFRSQVLGMVREVGSRDNWPLLSCYTAPHPSHPNHP